jgi:hypothetical protein
MHQNGLITNSARNKYASNKAEFDANRRKLPALQRKCAFCEGNKGFCVSSLPEMLY